MFRLEVTLRPTVYWPEPGTWLCLTAGGREMWGAQICSRVSVSSRNMCRNCLCQSLQAPATSSCPSSCLTLNNCYGLALPDSSQPITHHSLVELPAADASHQVLPLSLFSWLPFVYQSFTSSFLSSSGPQSRSVSFTKPPSGSALSVLPSQSSSRAYF